MKNVKFTQFQLLSEINASAQISEGLIKNQTRSKVKEILKRQIPGISFPDKDTEDFVKDLGNEAKLRVEIPKLTLPEFEKFNSTIQALGWFPSYSIGYVEPGDGEKRDMYEPGDDLRKTIPFWQGKYDKQKIIDYIKSGRLHNIVISLEASFGPEVPRNKLPKLLYHATPSMYIEKISKIGLAPKTQSKETIHPSRVYFVPVKSSLKNLAGGLNQYRKPKKGQIGIPMDSWSMITIDTKKLSPDVEFYVDPNFWVGGTVQRGYFTTSNIPPSAIVDISRMDIAY